MPFGYIDRSRDTKLAPASSSSVAINTEIFKGTLEYDRISTMLYEYLQHAKIGNYNLDIVSSHVYSTHVDSTTGSIVGIDDIDVSPQAYIESQSFIGMENMMDDSFYKNILQMGNTLAVPYHGPELFIKNIIALETRHSASYDGTLVGGITASQTTVSVAFDSSLDSQAKIHAVAVSAQVTIKIGSEFILCSTLEADCTDNAGVVTFTNVTRSAHHSTAAVASNGANCYLTWFYMFPFWLGADYGSSGSFADYPTYLGKWKNMAWCGLEVGSNSDESKGLVIRGLPTSTDMQIIKTDSVTYGGLYVSKQADPYGSYLTGGWDYYTTTGTSVVTATNSDKWTKIHTYSPYSSEFDALHTTTITASGITNNIQSVMVVFRQAIIGYRKRIMTGSSPSRQYYVPLYFVVSEDIIESQSSLDTMFATWGELDDSEQSMISTINGVTIGPSQEKLEYSGLLNILSVLRRRSDITETSQSVASSTHVVGVLKQGNIPRQTYFPNISSSHTYAKHVRRFIDLGASPVLSEKHSQTGTIYYSIAHYNEVDENVVLTGAPTNEAVVVINETALAAGVTLRIKRCDRNSSGVVTKWYINENYTGLKIMKRTIVQVGTFVIHKIDFSDTSTYAFLSLPAANGGTTEYYEWTDTDKISNMLYDDAIEVADNFNNHSPPDAKYIAEFANKLFVVGTTRNKIKITVLDGGIVKTEKLDEIEDVSNYLFFSREDSFHYFPWTNMIRFPGAIRGLASCKTHLYVGTDAGIYIVWGYDNFEVQRIDGNYMTMPGTMMAINGLCYLATRANITDDTAAMNGIFRFSGDNPQPLYHELSGLFEYGVENDGYNCEFQDNRYYVIRQEIPEINSGYHYDYLVYDVWLGGWRLDQSYTFSRILNEQTQQYVVTQGFYWKGNKEMLLERFLKDGDVYQRDFGHLPKQIYKIVVEAYGEFIINIYRDEESSPIKTIHKTFTTRSMKKFYGSWKKGQNFTIEILGKDGTIIYAVNPIMIAPFALSENTGTVPDPPVA